MAHPQRPSIRDLLRRPFVILIAASLAALLTAPVAQEWLTFVQVSRQPENVIGTVTERRVTLVTRSLQIRLFTPLELRYRYDVPSEAGGSFPQAGNAFVNRRTYQSFQPGDPISVTYAQAQPGISLLSGDLHARLVYSISTVAFVLLLVMAFRIALESPPSIRSIVDTMTSDIETMIQERLPAHPELAGRSIHIHTRPNSPLVIEVDGTPYIRVQDIEDESARTFIEGLVAEWTSEQLKEAR